MNVSFGVSPGAISLSNSIYSASIKSGLAAVRDFGSAERRLGSIRVGGTPSRKSIHVRSEASAILPMRHSEMFFGFKRDMEATRTNLSSQILEARCQTANAA
jgi:hypothetical protein